MKEAAMQNRKMFVEHMEYRSYFYLEKKKFVLILILEIFHYVLIGSTWGSKMQPHETSTSLW